MHIWVIQANFALLYVPSGSKPPRAIFLPGHVLFQHQWLSDPEKRVSRVCLQTRISDTTPQSVAARVVDQRPPKTPKSFWRSVLKRLPAYHFLAMTICCNTQAQAYCPQPRRKGLKVTLPRSTMALQFAEDMKRGQSNLAPTLPFSQFTGGPHTRGDGASKHAAAKTAAAAEQKSSPKHTKLPLWGINRMGSCWHQSWKLKVLRA